MGRAKELRMKEEELLWEDYASDLISDEELTKRLLAFGWDSEQIKLEMSELDGFREELLGVGAAAAYQSWIEGVEELEPAWEFIPGSHRERLERSIKAALKAMEIQI